MSYCAYADCPNKCVPCSSIAFFTLPQDCRRQVWIENSGNPELKTLKPSTTKQFCEKHFDPKYLRRQFTRTLLRKDAIPYNYNAEKSTSSVSPKQKPLPKEIVKRYAPNLDRRNTEENVHAEHIILKTQQVVYEQPEYRTSPDVSSSQPDADDTGVEEYTDISMLIVENRDLDFHDDLDFIADVEQDETNVIEDTGAETSTPPTSHFEQSFEERQVETIVHAQKDVEKSRTSTSSEDYEEDKHYVLSLLGYFRRLQPKSKSLAKLKILQYLTELEFDSTSDALNH